MPGRSGRRKLPTALKVLRGENRASRTGAEVTGRLGADPPDWLTPLQRSIWDHWAPRLTAQRVLTELDRDVLADYCIAQAVIIERNLVGDDPGIAMMRLVQSYQDRLWMGAAGRLKGGVQPEDKGSKLQRFIGGKKA